MSELSLVYIGSENDISKDSAAFLNENGAELVCVCCEDESSAYTSAVKNANGIYTAFIKNADENDIKNAYECYLKAKDAKQDWYFEAKDLSLFGKVFLTSYLKKAADTAKKFSDEYLLPLFILNVSPCDVNEAFYDAFGTDDKEALLDKLIYLHNDDKKNLRYITFEKDIQKSDVKNIAFFYNRMHDGGVERVMSLLSTEFAKNGKKVFIITKEKEHENDHKAPFAERICLDEQKMHMATAFISILKEKNIDAIVLNDAYDSSLICYIIAAKTAGAYPIVCQHGAITSMMHYRGDDIRAYENAYLSASAFVVMSEFSKRYAETRGIKAYKIYNPYIPSLNNCKRSDLSGDILFLGRLSKEKHPDKAIEIMRYVAGVKKDAKLLLVGPCEDEVYGEKLKTMCEEYGIEQNVIFAGRTDNVEAYLQKAKMLVFTSVIEGQPLAVIEAKAHGVPLVGFRLEFSDYFLENKGIYSAAYDDPKGAAEKITELLENEEKLKALAKEAYDSFDKYKNYDLMGAWESVFEDLKNEKQKTEADGFSSVLVDCIFNTYNERPKDIGAEINEDTVIAATLFYGKGGIDGKKTQTQRKVFSKEMSFCFDIKEDADVFRFDPAEAGGLAVRLKNITCFSGDERTEISKKDISTNAVVSDDIYIFPTDDPQMLFDTSKSVSKVEICYEIIDKQQANIIADSKLLYETLEKRKAVATLFYSKDAQFTCENAITLYRKKEKNMHMEFCLPENSGVSFFRFDPAEQALSIRFNYIKYFCGEEVFDITHKSFIANAAVSGDILNFVTHDPQMIIRIENKNVSKFVFDFDIIDEQDAARTVDEEFLYKKLFGEYLKTQNENVSTLYFAKAKAFNAKDCIQKQFEEKERYVMSFDIPQEFIGSADSYRFDPAEKSIAVKFNSVAYFEGENKTEVPLRNFEANAVIKDDVFVFPSGDPQMCITLKGKKITRFVFDYEVISCAEAGSITEEFLLKTPAKKRFIR